MSSGTFNWLTAPEPAAISLVRVSALPPSALDRAVPAPGTARFARLLDQQRQVIDEVVVWNHGPGALELSVHGGGGVRAAVTRCLQAHGLSEAPRVPAAAEAIRPGPGWWDALAWAPSPAAARWLMRHRLRQPPFAVEFLRRPPLVLLTGGVNAGKSTLLNWWCGRERALVSARPGTTRDLLAAETTAGGWRLKLLDSAGLRRSDDPLERAGQELVAAARLRCDLVIYLRQPGEAQGWQERDLLVQGKADLLDEQQRAASRLPWSQSGLPGLAGADLLQRLSAAVLERLGLPWDAREGEADQG